jgi:hypothetical protein
MVNITKIKKAIMQINLENKEKQDNVAFAMIKQDLGIPSYIQQGTKLSNSGTVLTVNSPDNSTKPPVDSSSYQNMAGEAIHLRGISRLPSFHSPLNTQRREQ